MSVYDILWPLSLCLSAPSVESAPLEQFMFVSICIAAVVVSFDCCCCRWFYRLLLFKMLCVWRPVFCFMSVFNVGVVTAADDDVV